MPAKASKKKLNFVKSCGSARGFSSQLALILAANCRTLDFRRIILSSVGMHKSFQFRDLADLFAKANEEKSGDQLAGLAAESEQERVAAKFALADVQLQQVVANPLIPPEQDDVTRLILETHDRRISKPSRA